MSGSLVRMFEAGLLTYSAADNCEFHFRLQAGSALRSNGVKFATLKEMQTTAAILNACSRPCGHRRILNMGCGNGSVAKVLATMVDVIAIYSSERGIPEAKRAFPHIKFPCRHQPGSHRRLVPRECIRRSRETLSPGGAAPTLPRWA